MLTLDLVRHGEAEPAAAEGDDARRLTGRGAAAIRALGDGLRVLPRQPDRVFASPLARARQTAVLLAAALGADDSHVETLAELRPEAEPLDLLGMLQALGADDGHVMLVGHMPLLGRLFELLTGRREGFEPGKLKRVECPDGARANAGTCVLVMPG